MKGPVTPYLTELVKAYVPDASTMTWGDAAYIALVQDELAAEELEASAGTQLDLEAAHLLVSEFIGTP